MELSEVGGTPALEECKPVTGAVNKDKAVGAGGGRKLTNFCKALENSPVSLQSRGTFEGNGD